MGIFISLFDGSLSSWCICFFFPLVFIVFAFVSLLSSWLNCIFLGFLLVCLFICLVFFKCCLYLVFGRFLPQCSILQKPSHLSLLPTAPCALHFAHRASQFSPIVADYILKSYGLGSLVVRAPHVHLTPHDRRR